MRPIDRRCFLKLSAGTLGILALPGGLVSCARGRVGAQGEGLERTVVTSCAHDCGGRCVLVAHLHNGTIARISTDDGSLADTYGVDRPDLPQIRACLRGRSYRNRVYSPHRLKYPMRRIGKRGEGRFVRISWEEAYDRIASEMVRIKEKYGPAAILNMAMAGDTVSLLNELYPFLPWSLPRRFLDLFGSAVHWWDTPCFEGLVFAAGHTLGDLLDGSEADNFLYSKLVVLWGHNPAYTIFGTNTPWYLKLAKERGARFVAVDPIYTDSAAAYGAEWIPIRPATDTAMVLAMIYVIATEGLYDKAFVDRYTLGFDEEHLPKGAPPGSSFKSYLLGLRDGVPKTPQWAESITGVPAARIASFAREFARTKPVALFHGWGPGRVPHGEQFHRAAYTLAVITGNIGVLGAHAAGVGGAFPGTAAIFPPTRPPVKTTVRLSKWADAVLLGEKASPQLIGNFADAPPPNIKMIYVTGFNFLQQTPNIRKNVEAIQKVEFVVCHEQFMNFTGKFADILLPVATHLEADDAATAWTRGHYLIYRHKVIDPLYESRRDLEIFTDLAERLGFKEKFNNHTREEWIKMWVEQVSAQFGVKIDYEDFKRKGVYKFHLPEPAYAWKDQIADPEKHPFPTPSGKVEIYSQQMAEYDWKKTKYGAPIPPIPTYIPPEEGPGTAIAKKYPLQAVTPHWRHRTHSTWDNVPWLRETYTQHVLMSSADARRRGIRTGDVVKVHNDRGATVLPAVVSERIMPGVVAIFEGAWCDLDADGVDHAGSANMLTPDWASPSGAYFLNGFRVEVEKTDLEYRPGWDKESAQREWMQWGAKV